jgi:hypothetical protein
MKAPRYVWILIAALTIGLIAGAAWPPPPLPKLKQDNMAWSLPKGDSLLRHNPKDLATVISQLRWKGSGSSASGESSAWRLAGIVNKGGPVILIMTPDKPEEIKRIAIGAPLPDGSRLLSVAGDQATTNRDGCLMTYQLYQDKAVNTSGHCETLEAPAQGNTP